MNASDLIVKTTHGDIAVTMTASDGPPVLLVHGNSNCKETWRHQYEGALGERYRMIALDLPGHGASSDAADPEGTYTMPAYAAMCWEVADALEASRPVVIGSSLGGHIGIEMIPLRDGLRGLLISGTPPVTNAGPEAIAEGFIISDDIGHIGKRDLTEDEVRLLADIAFVPGKVEDWAVNAVRRTDGRAREIMFGHFGGGQASDQRAIVETSEVPLAVVNGADDAFMNPAYIGGLNYRNLWGGEVVLLPGLHHLPFYEDPAAFNPILERFLADVTS